MNSVIDLGFISIHWYSIFIFIAIIVGAELAIREAKKWDVPENFMLNLIFFTFVFGVIGARLYFVLFNIGDYLQNPIDIFKIWTGGLAIHGGIIAGVIFIFFYCKKYKVNTMRILDILAISLIIAQAIGRWGNFFNGEAHGPETSLAYLQNLHLPEFIIDGMNIGGTYYIPTFFYESIWCVLGFIVLLLFRRIKNAKIGQVTSLYLIWYGIGRFFIESLRTDSLMLTNIKVAQLVSLGMIIIGIIIFVIVSRKSKFSKLYNDKENVDVRL